MLMALLSSIALAQSSGVMNDTVELKISSSAFNSETFFHLSNINGRVKAEGYDGNEILVTGTKTVEGRGITSGEFDPDDFYLDRLEGGNNIFVFIRQPGVEVSIDGDDLHYKTNHRNRKWDGDDVDFEFNLHVKIPHYLMAELSTINGEKVEVVGLSNGVEINNINGRVVVKEVEGKVKARTVNGDIWVEYASTPSELGEFNTVNGNIEVFAPENLSAVVTFKSLHGELYTDFDQVKYLPNQVDKSSDGMNRYRIGKTAPIQFGNGGPELRLQLLNGNAYIKQKNS
jgi:hypothetical protein